jgi:hypothetical protein
MQLDPLVGNYDLPLPAMGCVNSPFQQNLAQSSARQKNRHVPSFGLVRAAPYVTVAAVIALLKASFNLRPNSWR